MKSYNKTIWVNEETLISAENLNNIEDQVEHITTEVSSIATNFDDINNKIDKLHKTPINVSINEDSIVFRYTEEERKILLEKDIEGRISKLTTPEGSEVTINYNSRIFKK